MSITENLERVREEIASACQDVGRDPAEVTLIAVTKTFSVEVVRRAFDAGLRELGENRVQEIRAKAPELADLPIHWHMIGHLQTNKVRQILPHVVMIHSVDRPRLAEEISRRADSENPIDVLIEVNTTGESTKSGIEPSGVDQLVDLLRGLPGLTLQGMMTIGPLGGSETENRAAFAVLHRLRERIGTRHSDLTLPVLSMGMSGDFPLAIREGATHVRIGSRIFGARG